MMAKPREFLKVFVQDVDACSRWLYLHCSQVAIHFTWHMHEKIWLGFSIWATSEMRMSGLVYLTAEAKRERVPQTAELVV
jgi:hypothetical protein